MRKGVSTRIGGLCVLLPKGSELPFGRDSVPTQWKVSYASLLVVLGRTIEPFFVCVQAKGRTERRFVYFFIKFDPSYVIDYPLNVSFSLPLCLIACNYS